MKRLYFVVMLLASFGFATAQNPGDLDQTFGNNGILEVSPSASFNQARNFMVMPDGKIMVAGAARVGDNNDMFLARLNPDGSYDTSFGDGGVIIYRPANFYAHYPDDIDMMGDKIIVAGYMFEPGTVPFLMCLNQDGSLNTDFAGGGFSAIDNGFAMVPRHMVVKDEMIYWSGYRNDIACVARFYPDGNIDSSFGENGFAITPLNDYLACNGEELVVLDNGKIIVAGWHNNYGSNYNSAVYCLNPDGSLDTSFADNGILRLNLSQSHDFFVSICQQNDGKLIAGGHYWIADSPALQYGVALVRFDEKGVLDPTFGDNGIFMHQYFANGESYCVDVEIAEDNQIFFGGWYQCSGERNLFAASVNNDGTVNTDFGNDGYTVIPYDGDHQAYDMDIDANGRLVVMGHDYYNVLLARLHSGVITDVKEIALPDNKLRVYPNPVADELHINGIQEEGTAMVYDVMGRKVLETTLKTNGSLNVANLPQGAYMLMVIGKNETYKAQFVK